MCHEADVSKNHAFWLALLFGVLAFALLMWGPGSEAKLAGGGAFAGLVACVVRFWQLNEREAKQQRARNDELFNRTETLLKKQPPPE